MKLSRTELREAVRNLSTQNKDKAYSHLEKIFKIIISNVDAFTDDKAKDWHPKANQIRDIFYDSLSETYANTSKTVNGLYDSVKPFKIKDIFNITYRKDGKTLEERINSYWDEGLSQLQDGENPAQVKTYLEYYFERLLVNETAVVETVIKHNKIPMTACILVIEGGCECGHGECDHYVGEYPADDPIDLPPYHPNCGCLWWYEETTDPDEISDLDLDPDHDGNDQIDIEVEE